MAFSLVESRARRTLFDQQESGTSSPRLNRVSDTKLKIYLTDSVLISS